MGKEDKLNQLLSVALKLFAKYGYKKTTVEDVANELGITKGALYFYVKNKKDLYEKSIGHALIRWKERVMKAISDKDDVVEKFMTMAQVSYEYLSYEKDLRAILLKDPTIYTLSRKEDRFYEINLGAMQVIKNILIQGIEEKRFRPVNVEYAAEVLFSVYIMFIIKTYVKSEGSSARKMYDEAYSMVLNGLLENK